MADKNIDGLNLSREKPEFKTPLLERAWAYMPNGTRQIVSSVPIIPAIAAKAKSIAAHAPDFIRSDQGQVVGIFPEKEIYYGPSSGLVELRELVGQFWTYAYRLHGKPGIPEGGLHHQNVAIVSGATEGLSIIMRIFAHQQNVGLMPLHWSNYKGIIMNAGGNPVVIDLFDQDYHINFADLENKIQNLIILSDEVYNFIRYKGQPQSMLSYAPERTVVISSASKEYLIPGARVGYVIATDETFTNVWMPRLIRSFSSSPNVLGQRLLIDILKEEVNDFANGRSPRFITKVKSELRQRLELIISILTEKGFTLAGRDKNFPSGAISVLAKLPEYIKVDDKVFIDKALELKKFSAVPGSVFGAPRCIRFGYAGMTQETINKLSQNLQDVLDFYKT